jgi:hypothetical protein
MRVLSGKALGSLPEAATFDVHLTYREARDLLEQGPSGPIAAAIAEELAFQVGLLESSSTGT